VSSETAILFVTRARVVHPFSGKIEMGIRNEPSIDVLATNAICTTRVELFKSRENERHGRNCWLNAVSRSGAPIKANSSVRGFAENLFIGNARAQITRLTPVVDYLLIDPERIAGGERKRDARRNSHFPTSFQPRNSNVISRLAPWKSL